jgi:hypothetical protein
MDSPARLAAGITAAACMAGALLVLAVTPGAARDHPPPKGHPRPFGTRPLPISVGMQQRPANSASGGVAISGDNRKTRLVAFHSRASNLVPRDTNGATDVFIWHRPRGKPGVRLNRLTRRIARVSVNDIGAQGNGDSINPSLDGSLTTVPHCVAFQSLATNLDPDDTDPGWDVYVRDLRKRRTYLVSRGVDAPATNPSIDGHCRRVAFAAGGLVYVGLAHGKYPPRRIGHGKHPNYARDARAVVWTSAGVVWIRRRGVTSRVGHGFNPRVSDEEFGVWGVAFDTRRRLTRSDHDHRVDVFMRIVGRRGGTRRTILVSKVVGGDAWNGGITTYGQNRGIVVFGIREGRGSALWYYNKHTGHVDDIAYTPRGRLDEVATSARANFVAFTSRRRLSPLYHARHSTVYVKHLVDGQTYGAAY